MRASSAPGKPRRNIARPPFDTTWPIVETSTGGSPSSARRRDIATTRSGAESISVPSRSKKTAAISLPRGVMPASRRRPDSSLACP